MKKWQEMTKEQKQLVVMSGVLGLIVVFLFFQFGLSPFLARKARMTEEFEKLEAQLDLANEAIKGETQLRDSLTDKTSMLELAYREYIPAPENPLSWATKKIYGEARGVGVDIESVSEVGVDQAWTHKDQDKRAFKPYSVRIATQCTYAQLVRLIRVLERNNPRMYVCDVSIQARDTGTGKHMVSIVVEWPSWKAADKIPNFSGADTVPAPAAAPAAPATGKS
jgi:hypothetical protein